LEQAEQGGYEFVLDDNGQKIFSTVGSDTGKKAYLMQIDKEWYEEDITYVKTGDVKELLKKTLILLRNKKLREEMGRKGKKRVRNYSWDFVADYEFQVFAKTLLRQNEGPP